GIRPRLTRRSDAVLSGKADGTQRSRTHYVYVAFEVLKVGVLIALGAALLAWAPTAERASPGRRPPCCRDRRPSREPRTPSGRRSASFRTVWRCRSQPLDRHPEWCIRFARMHPVGDR